jgi:deoxyribose-phosphate aldolase
VGKIKTTYINQMCNELRKRAADELDLVERLSHVKRGNKRAREVRDIGSRTLGVRRAKLHGVSITNELDF